MRRSSSLLIFVLAASGCGEETTNGGAGAGGTSAGTATGVDSCPPGQRELEDGSCVLAGWQPNGCAAGELADDAGQCVPAGLAPEDCGEGFAHDGDVGCEPVLPDEACGPGTWAIPGDTACRDFSSACGSAPYPDVPAGVTAIHVDATATEPPDGTASAPYPSLQAAVDAASDGSMIAIAEGSYATPVVVAGKSLTLRGRCAGLVTLVAAGEPALTFGADASSSAAAGLAITGDGHGVVVEDAIGIELSDMWLHDLTGHGLHVERLTAPSEATLRNSLLDAVTGRGVYAIGAEVTVEETAIRDLQINALDFGRAVDTDLQPDTGEPNVVTMRRLHVERAVEVAVMIHASSATMTDTLIRDTRHRSTGRLGRAVNLQTTQADKPAEMTLSRSVIDGAYDSGVVVTAASLDMDRVVIRNVEPNADDGIRGYGLAAQGLAVGEGQVDATRSLIENVSEAGLLAGGATVVVESLVVRDTELLTGVDHPVLPESFGGRGVTIQREVGAGIPGSLTIRGSVVERVHDVAIASFGASLTVQGTRVAQVGPVGANYGRGVLFQNHLEDGTPSSGTIVDSLVSEATEAGVFVSGGSADIEGLRVEKTKPTSDDINGVGIWVNFDTSHGSPTTAEIRHSAIIESITAGLGVTGAQVGIFHSLIEGIGSAPAMGGIYGDGVVVIVQQVVPSVALHDNRIVDAERVGIASFGGHVQLLGNEVACAAIDLTSSSHQLVEPIFDDLGGNRCGCGDEERICKALDVDLAVPEPIDSL